MVADRPGVGQNLQDHLELYIQQACIQPITLYSLLNLFGKAWAAREWMLFKTGLGATNQFEARPSSAPRRHRLSRHPVPFPALRGAL